MVARDPHHHLELVLPLRREAPSDLDELLDVVLGQAERDVGGDTALGAAEEAPHRHPERLALDVPKGYVDCADGGAPRARLRTGVEVDGELLPDALRLERVLPRQDGSSLSVDELAHCVALDGPGDPVADGPVVGLDSAEHEWTHHGRGEEGYGHRDVVRRGVNPGDSHRRTPVKAMRLNDTGVGSRPQSPAV